MTDYDWHRVDRTQQSYCKVCTRTTLECAATVAPECAYMQSLLLRASENTKEMQRPLPVPAGYVARDEVIPKIIKMIEEAGK